MGIAAIFLNFYRIKLMHRLILGFSPALVDIIFYIQVVLGFFLLIFIPPSFLDWM